MAPQDLVVLALRVLSAWNMGRNVNPKDLETLRQHASQEWPSNIGSDELACLIVRREADRVIAESRASRKGIKTERRAKTKDKIA
jgi:hypothetical protein